MLIFSRKPGEHFTIGDNITVTVRRIRGNRVTLSFEAPTAVRIARQEVARTQPLDHPIAASHPPIADASQACV